MKTYCRLAIVLLLALAIYFFTKPTFRPRAPIAPAAPSAPADLIPLDADILGTDVEAMAVQPDGKMIIAGEFRSVLGVKRNHIARLNTDGTLDMGFDPNPSHRVWCVALQADGKVLVGGTFQILQPFGASTYTERRFIARLNADGTLDTGFDPKPSAPVRSIAVQADGKILLGGMFQRLQPNGAKAPTDRGRIARVNADGTLDTGFGPKLNDDVFSIAVQTDGKILLAGEFTAFQPNGTRVETTRNRIARLNADGTLDMGFDPNVNNDVRSVALQADGKVLVGGFFTALQPNGASTPIARNKFARVNADGTLDTGFDPNPNHEVHSIAVQADGKVLLGGAFTTLQPNGLVEPIPRKRLARVNADGTLDTGFYPNPDKPVFCVVVQPDGRVLLGGDFGYLQPQSEGPFITRRLFTRLVKEPGK